MQNVGTQFTGGAGELGRAAGPASAHGGELGWTSRFGADLAGRTAAKVAGLALLVMAALAIFANFAVTENLIVSGDAAATARNIAEHESLFRAGAAVWPIVAVLDVVVALALYVVFRPVNRSLAILAGWFRLAYAAVFVAAMFNFLGALQLLSGAGYLEAIPAGQRDAQLLLALESFDHGWTIGLILFGAHLGVLGYLALRSGYVPRVLGWLLLATAAGYLADSFLTVLVPAYGGTAAALIAIPTFFGEILLAIWLLGRSGRVPDTQDLDARGPDTRITGTPARPAGGSAN